MSPLYEDPCPYCGINYDLVYLCTDCHEVFCVDCVNNRTEETFLCLNCGGNEIFTDKQGLLYCTHCHSHEVQTLNKIHPFCPNCQGRNIVKITDTQTRLIDEFKSMVYATRDFLTPLDQLLVSFNEKRLALLRLREDEPKCYHHPNLESEFIILFKLFDATKKNVYDQVSGYFNELQRHLNYIVEIPRTYPNNLPFIEGILKNLKREQEKIAQNAQDALIPLKKRYEEINEKLQTIENIQNLFISFITKLQLEVDEKIVYGIKCKLAEGSNGGTDISGKNGTILITSKRLHFFQEQGVFKKKMVLLFSVKLEDLQQIGVKGRLKKTVSLDFVNSMYNFSLTKDKRDELIDWIEKARVFDSRNTLDNTNIEKLEKYKLEIKLFKEELENAIYELIGFKGIQLQQNSKTIPNIANQTINSPLYHNYNANSMFQTNHTMDQRNLKTIKQPPLYNNQVNINQQSCRFSPNGENQFNSAFTQPQQPRYGPQNYYPNSKMESAREYYNNQYHQPELVQTQKFSPAQEYEPYPSRYSNPYQDPNINCYGSSPQRSIPPSFHQQFNQPSSPKPFSNTAFDQDYQQQSNLSNLKQEEYGLLQTVKMLEQRFDGGMMNNIEFVKSYRNLQKDLYVVQEKIRQFQQTYN